MQKLKGINFFKVLILSLIIFFTVISLFDLGSNFIRIFYHFAIDWNEGSNCYKIDDIIKGKELYSNIIGLPVTPTTYPPLSFLFFSLLSYFSGSILITGRILAFVALILTLLLTFLILNQIINSRKISFLSSLLLLMLITLFTPHYIGMLDPQILAHVFSLSGLYVFIKCKNQYSNKNIIIVTFLLYISIFIKHNLVALPFAVALFLFITDKRVFLKFIIVNTIFIIISVLCIYIFTPHFFSNFFDANREFFIHKVVKFLRILFIDGRLFITVIICITIIIGFLKKYLIINLYLIFALIFGIIFSGGDGVDLNIWYDFFIALSFQIGIFYSISEKFYLENILAKRLALLFICVISIIPFLKVRQLYVNPIEELKTFKENETLYLNNVNFLRSYKDPTLFEEPLVGFLSGKKFIFDPFCGTELMRAGKIPEAILVDKLKTKYFNVIVLRENLNKLVKEEDYQYWTNNVLQSMKENYFLISKKKVNYETDYYYYVPKALNHSH